MEHGQRLQIIGKASSTSSNRCSLSCVYNRHFGTQAHSQLSSALLTATSNTHGMLTSNSAFKNTSWFHIYNNGLTEKFNYGDCGPPKFTATANSLFFYGTEFNNPSYILYQHDRPDAPDPLSMLWYNPRIEGSWFYDLPLDREFPDPNSAWVSMRSSWTDIKGLFVAMKAGRGLGHQTRMLRSFLPGKAN